MNMVKSIVTTNQTVDPLSYRNAMSQFAGAVNIVTTNGSAGRRGLTLSAGCSVSDNPATILICLQRVHTDNLMFIENGVFAFNVLHAGQQDLAEAFAGRNKLTMEERFALGEWDEMVTGSPVLKGALASFDCKVISCQDHATHHVLFGEVLNLRQTSVEQLQEDTAEALVYLNRSYHQLKI
ncbi:flavin reductase family protein [Pseudochrobactrum sp. sp1633]|uniref:flavin reductase family protein n=1 Tax=Pseudochrobactrum sp. sp1633 TaxID=3036706 RepID=UPI0025A665BD|nr:flavin reductase family protein [Pseudochrobactrum sp. sp1633]MDM8343839.1 flavin reductase family protein [Pseudochrobactrum sp. sp1633]HWD11769.1 flavin reductase family protein [Pseudochrobactrum sp.]